MKHSKSGLFLMELIIALLFFSLASTVCVRLFVKSGMLSDDTVNLTYAVSQAQNLAECFLSCDGDLNALHSLFPGSEMTQADLLTYKENNYISTIRFSPQNEDGLICGDIAIYNSQNEEIYSLQILHHVAERRGINE